jgi:hypothetical protein
MKALVSALVFLGLLAGCSKKPAPDFIPDPRGWLIESYDNAVITVRHQGHTYKATCNSLIIPGDPPCNFIVELVGESIPDGPMTSFSKTPQTDIGGLHLMVVMTQVNAVLLLERRWEDGQNRPINAFTITSVTKTPAAK